MKAKPIIIGLVVLAIAATLFYFFVLKPKQATTMLVPVVNADGTVTTRAVTRTYPCAQNGQTYATANAYINGCVGTSKG